MNDETEPIRIGYKTGPMRTTKPDITVVGTRAGFIGTKQMLTHQQKNTFRYVIRNLKPREIHHRKTTGGDEDICFGIKLSGASIRLIAHPSTSEAYRADFSSDEEREPREFPDCSRDVVDGTDYLIAAPQFMYKNPGGLWFTVNYARKRKRPRVIIWPDGSIDYYDVPGVSGK